MPRIFQTVIKRIVSGGGTTNARSTVKPAIRLTNRLTALLATVKAGVRVSQGPSTRRLTQKPALRLSNIISGTPGTVSTKPALRLTNRITPPTTQTKPAMNITQVKYDLVSVKGSNSVTESAVAGRTDWVNDANAVGVQDATEAQFDGSALGARGGRLDFSYANYVNKTELTITKVELHYWLSTAGTVLNNADVQLQYDIGAGVVTLQTITGDVSATPAQVHDITSAIGGDWSKLDALTTHVRCDAAIAELWQCQLDAVEVRVEATKTDAL